MSDLDSKNRRLCPIIIFIVMVHLAFLALLASCAKQPTGAYRHSSSYAVEPNKAPPKEPTVEISTRELFEPPLWSTAPESPRSRSFLIPPSLRGNNIVTMRNPFLDVKGNKEVRIVNHHPFTVLVGLRLLVDIPQGKDFNVPVCGKQSVFAPPGDYDIFFVYSIDPDTVYQGDRLTLGPGSPEVEIRLEKVLGGNYSIRRVK